MPLEVLDCHSQNEAINKSFMRSSERLDRRHYKKDTRFLLDLYTLTYDNHESVDSFGDFTDRRCESLNLYNTSNFSHKHNVNIKNDKNHTNSHCYRRPSLQARMQDGKNMQLCYVNEQSIYIEDNHIQGAIFSLPTIPPSNYTTQESNLISLPLESATMGSLNCQHVPENVYNDDNNNQKSSQVQMKNNINWKYHLSQDACISLENVCEETKRQLQLESRRRSDSPITCTIKTSLKKVGATFEKTCGGRHRMNRYMLTKMNVDQLQVIINDLHLHVENLNEQLMTMLMERDELHMKRDSLLVDIEDLTTYMEDAKPTLKKHDIKRKNLKGNYLKNNARRDNLPSSCSKNLISGLCFKRLTTSYIKN